jgi:molybdenum cofactor biosynthesis protein B
MGTKDHKEKADKETPARCAVLTVSDTRTRDTDTSGRTAAELFRQAGHEVVLHEIIPNNEKKLGVALATALNRADVVVTIGGTGISRRDLSADVVRGFVVKELPGFGELFRSLSAKEIGTATILSRALLGVTKEDKVLLALPGSEGAVRLGLEGILLRELKHLLWEIRRYS